jgi:tRNA pseudouridine38-40 synthase
VNKLYPVGPEAHARFDAIARTYEYYLSREKNPFRQRYAYYLSRPLNLELLSEATAYLLTHEDFTSFSKVKGDTLHYRCQMHAAFWQETEHGLRFTIRANRFLRGMARLVVGTLLDVGSGKISPRDFQDILAAQDRRRASGAAPAAALFLTQVTYPDNYFEVQKEKFYQNKTSALL